MAIVKKYKVKVEQIKNPLPDIFTLTFTSEKKFTYLPGQFLHLALDEYDGIGQWPESRCFSMQSSPEEENIQITFAVKGNFTTRMKNELYEGKELWLKLPYGDLFQRNHDKNNCVFIAGGTGITPFLSLFNHRTFAEYTNPKIFLGFRSVNYNIYRNELELLYQINKKSKVEIYYEDKIGVINISEILNECGEHSTYFISGPPMMIKNFKNFLLNKHIAENKIITDDWE